MRFLSVLGDSISTYEGYNPKDYSVFYDNAWQKNNGLATVYDTWWAKVNQAMHAYLCVNDSFSGSLAAGVDFPAASCPKRLRNLRTEEYDPDVILIYIGLNDFGNGVKPFIKKELPNKNYFVFENAYEKIITSLKRIYPKSYVVCATLMKTRLADDENWKFPERLSGEYIDDYNNVIRSLCEKHNCCLADLDATGICYETLDGIHPTKTGHQEMANAWISCLEHKEWFDQTTEKYLELYHSNDSKDISEYEVFEKMTAEKILIPVSQTGKVMPMVYDGQSVVGVFTSPEQMPENEHVNTKIGYISEITDVFSLMQIPAVINPLSDEKMQLFIPHEWIEKRLVKKERLK